MSDRIPTGFSEHGLTRRSFLKQAGTALTFTVLLRPTGLRAEEQAETREQAVGPWVRVDSNGEILIYNPAAEMGQGSMTALPVILAEEMDADWERVRIENSPIEPSIYGFSGWGGRKRMITVGSFAVSSYFTQLRLAGAQIRGVFVETAARKWNVPASELTTRDSVVTHAGSGRSISYGEIVKTVKTLPELPDVDESRLKHPSKFRLIGRDVPRQDIPAKTDGSAVYSLDVRLPGMLHAVLLRSPLQGGKPLSCNDREVAEHPGVTTCVKLENGIAVLGDTIEAVLSAREALEIKWTGEAVSNTFDSEEALASYRSLMESGSMSRLGGKGDAAAALEQASRRYTADYYCDHLHHAQMEPLNAVASVAEDGRSAEIWAGTQAPWSAREAAAQALGLSTDQVTLHPCYLGGGFGRRSNSEYITEAALLAKAVKRPVKLLWTRRDDLEQGQFRPMCMQRLSAGVDSEGRLIAWTHGVVGDGGRLNTSGIGISQYDIPNQDFSLDSPEHGIRLKHWRAVGHGPNKFAIESFVDEIAAGQSVDPLELRRTLLQKSPRALEVVNTVAKMANWGRPAPKGRARGMAFGERSGSLVAGVAEISLDSRTGRIRVHKFWCAVDGGIIVQPRNARAQVEGGIVHGLSSVLVERATMKNGRVQQSNFHDYPILRISDTPEIEVQFIQSYEPPSGMGEASLPIVGGAVANAFAALTGKRLRHLPLTPDRVLSALA